MQIIQLLNNSNYTTLGEGQNVQRVDHFGHDLEYSVHSRNQNLSKALLFLIPHTNDIITNTFRVPHLHLNFVTKWMF